MYRQSFENWKRATNQRQKLQWTYGVVALIGLLVAGLIGLVDRGLADNLLQVAYGAVVLLVVNFVVWAIITTFLGDEPAAPVAKSTKARK